MAEVRTRLARERESKLLSAAVALAETEGYQFITRDMVAQRAGYSAGSVNAAFGTMLDLKRAVVRHAVAHAIIPIVAEALAAGSPAASDASPDLKEKCAEFVRSRA